MKDEIFFRESQRHLKDVPFHWDERTNFERAKDVHIRSHANWVSYFATENQIQKSKQGVKDLNLLHEI